MDKQNDIPTYHILAISGGGYRGLYSAAILEELEKSLGGSIAKHFDLICGTSAGGLLALGLAKEIPAADLFLAFKEHGETIFGKVGLWRKFLSYFHICAKHSGDGLRAVATQLFGDAKLGDLSHRILIPSVNYTTGKGKFFKTPYHHSFSTDYKLPIVDVALATAAAPTYFPLAKNTLGVFADGGLVGNSPGLFGLHEIKKFIHKGDGDCRIRVLSIGTMTIHKEITQSKIVKASSLDRGFLRYRENLFDLMLSAQESSIHYVLEHILGEHYLRIDDQLDASGCYKGALNDCSENATDILENAGRTAAKKTLATGKFTVFQHHTASAASFYHGPFAQV